MNEQFLHLVAREEERQRQEERVAAHSQTPVKTKMLRRISRAAAEQAATTDNEGGRKKKGEKRSGKGFLKKRRAAVGKREGEGGGKMRRERTRSTVEEKADNDFVLLPLDSSGYSGGSHETTSPPDRRAGDESLAEEIGRQFVAVTQTPTTTGGRKSGHKLRAPKLKRLSKAEGGSLSNRTQTLLGVADKLMESLEGSRAELLPPLVVSRSPARHDGNVVTQELENTDGIRVPDVLDLLSTRSRTRLTVGPDSFPPSASGSEPALEPTEVSQTLLGSAPSITGASMTQPPPPLSPPPPPPPPVASLPQVPSPPPLVMSDSEGKEGGEGADLQASQELSESRGSGDTPKHKSRASELLETMEEGEVETRSGKNVHSLWCALNRTGSRIDGDSEGATLLKTSMGEKETAIIGLPTILLPAHALEQFNQDTQKEER